MHMMNRCTLVPCALRNDKTRLHCDLQLLSKIQSESEKAKTLLEQRSYLQYQRKQICHAQRRRVGRLDSQDQREFNMQLHSRD
jgi:hypothetical protein